MTIKNTFYDFWQVLKQPLFELSGTKVSVINFLVAILVVASGFKIAGYLERFVARALRKRNVDIGVQGSIARFTRYAVVTATFFFALDAVGFKMSSLAAFGAILMVGIGFGLQNITQNFIAGIIILIERPVKTGDIVKVGDTSGRILDISVRSTLIQTRDDVSIIVPNSQLIAEQVVNNSFKTDIIRAHVRVGVAYGSDLMVVQKALLDCAKNHKEVLTAPATAVIFEDFGESSLNFDLRFWTREMWEIDRICSELRFMIDAEFRKQNIQIPFPQRDVHFINMLRMEPSKT